MCKKLKNRIAIVTAAGRGIGKGIALKLSREGADVAVADLDFQTAKTTAEEIEKIGTQSLAIQADVSNSDEVKEMVNSTIDKFGKNRYHSCINKPAPIWDVTEEVWDLTMKVNLKSVFLCSRQLSHL